MSSLHIVDDHLQEYAWVHEKLKKLQTLAHQQPQSAQDQLWQWLENLGKNDDQAVLAQLFSQGIAENPCAHTIGAPIGPMRNIAGGAFISAFLKLDSPWTGKTFYSDGTGGYNRIKPYTKIPMKILAPKHGLRANRNEYFGFNFDTTTEQGAVEPKVDVIAIQYDNPIYKNPSKIIPLTRVRDELVKLLPHTYLGRATFPNKHGEYQLVGYFALKTAISTEKSA